VRHWPPVSPHRSAHPFVVAQRPVDLRAARITSVHFISHTLYHTFCFFCSNSSMCCCNFLRFESDSFASTSLIYFSWYCTSQMVALPRPSTRTDSLSIAVGRHLTRISFVPFCKDRVCAMHTCAVQVLPSIE
jgi:hypothetical protein